MSLKVETRYLQIALSLVIVINCHCATDRNVGDNRTAAGQATPYYVDTPAGKKKVLSVKVPGRSYVFTRPSMYGMSSVLIEDDTVLVLLDPLLALKVLDSPDKDFTPILRFGRVRYIRTPALGSRDQSRISELLEPEIPAERERRSELNRQKHEQEAIQKARADSLADEERERADEEQERRKVQRRNHLNAKFGEVVARRILNREIWLGMTHEMARESWGEPNDNNRSVGSWGVHEQWVYRRGVYLYFENGILTSWQD